MRRLAAKAHRTRRILPAALGAVFSAARSEGHAVDPIPRRVKALLAVVLAVALLAGFCALEAANELQDLLALASSY